MGKHGSSIGNSDFMIFIHPYLMVLKKSEESWPHFIGRGSISTIRHSFRLERNSHAFTHSHHEMLYMLLMHGSPLIFGLPLGTQTNMLHLTVEKKGKKSPFSKFSISLLNYNLHHISLKLNGGLIL